MPRKGSPYGPRYERERRVLLAGNPTCAHCRRRRASQADHQPPLALHTHINGSGCCTLVPICARCHAEQAARLGAGERLPTLVVPELHPVEESLPVEMFDVAWLADLGDVPADAMWPRLMSAPHIRAVGSYGAEFEAWAQTEHGCRLRWWQRLVARRVLEHDEDGVLVWDVALLTVARQVGKTRLAWMLCDWRSEQGPRFGEPQLVLHTANIMMTALESLDAATPRADACGYHRVFAIGRPEIDKGPLGRWLVRANTATVGYTAAMAYVDESWAVKLKHLEQNLMPTTVEVPSAQVLLSSTAHPECSDTVPTYRAEAIDDLATGAGTLLLEWSAPAGSDIASRAAWRAASPHWSRRREEMIARAVRRAVPYIDAGAGTHELVRAIRCQWLNIWPRHGGVEARGERLLLERAWALRAMDIPFQPIPAIVAVVDNHGDGAAVAVIVPHDDLGLLEAGGWTCDTWSEAWTQAALVCDAHRRSMVVVDHDMTADASAFPRGTRFTSPPAGATRTGLSLLRAHVAERRIVHDGGGDLAAQLDLARVVRNDAGLGLVKSGRSDLVRGLSWALVEAELPAPAPAVY